MKIVHYVANVCILIGAAALLGGLFTKLFHFDFLNLWPSAYLKFADTCLLMGIALYARGLLPAPKNT
jgi:hypothetical protein